MQLTQHVILFRTNQIVCQEVLKNALTEKYFDASNIRKSSPTQSLVNFVTVQGQWEIWLG